MCSYEGGAGGSGRASAAAGSANPLPDFAGAGARAIHAIDANVGDYPPRGGSSKLCGSVRASEIWANAAKCAGTGADGGAIAGFTGPRAKKRPLPCQTGRKTHEMAHTHAASGRAASARGPPRARTAAHDRALRTAARPRTHADGTGPSRPSRGPLGALRRTSARRREVGQSRAQKRTNWYMERRMTARCARRLAIAPPLAQSLPTHAGGRIGSRSAHGEACGGCAHAQTWVSRGACAVRARRRSTSAPRERRRMAARPPTTVPAAPQLGHAPRRREPGRSRQRAALR